MSVSSVLGMRLKGWWTNNYNGVSWVDEQVACTAFTQATPARQPAISSTPAGTVAVDFDGSNDLLVGGAFTGWTAPGSGQTIEFGAYKRDLVQASTDERLINDDDSNEQISFISGTQLWRWGARSNAGVISNTNWHTFIMLRTVGGGDNVKQYFDGTLQTTQGSGALGARWMNARGMGCRHDNNTEFFNGRLACVGIAYTATTFSAQDITDLHQAISDFVNVSASAVTSFTYLITATLDDLVDGGRLKAEIATAGLTGLVSLDTGDGNIYIEFSPGLNPAQVNTLNIVVAAHKGTAPLGAFVGNKSPVAANQTVTTTSTVVAQTEPIPLAMWRVGFVAKATVAIAKTAAGTTAGALWELRLGTLGTTSDAVIASGPSTTPTAAVDSGSLDIQMEVTAVGAAATNVSWARLDRTGTTTGFANAISAVVANTPTAFSTLVDNQILTLIIRGGRGETVTVSQPAVIEILKSGTA